MHTAALHNSTIAIGTIPVYFAVNNTKARRYVLCLEMAETVLQDFFPNKQSAASPLFQTLGQVACCIDNHLDDLSVEQKETLADLLPAFFDSMSKREDKAVFSDLLWELCHQLNTSLYPPSLCTDLFQFYIFCAKHDLLPELKNFSMAVIESAILKSKAKNADEILKSLGQEGNAAVSFLLQLLQKENRLQHEHKKFKRLKNYLGRLEKMLNIADDLSDYKKDKAKGTITLTAGNSYYFALSARLLKTFFSTSFKYRFLFLKHFVVFTRRYVRSEIV